MTGNRQDDWQRRGAGDRAVPVSFRLSPVPRPPCPAVPVACHPSPVTCRSGFTLLEVIVSLALMAIGLVAVLEAFSAASRVSLQDEYLTTATHLAASKMEEVEKETTITAGSDEGDFGDEFADFSWTVQIADSPIQGLETVTVTVNWEVGGREDHLTLIGALPQTTSSSSAGGATASAAGGAP